MSALLIKGGWLIDGLGGEDKLDLLVEDGIIRQIGKDLHTPGVRVLDATGLWVVPGLIDMHCHLREPGYEYKETIASGTRAAARGGFTTVAPMANTQPVNDCAAVTAYILHKARTEGVGRVLPIGAITLGLEGKAMTEMGELKSAGCVALSDDGKSVADPRLLRTALQYASHFGLLLISHCEDPSLSAGGVMNEGAMSTLLGLPGITRAAEEVIVSRDILLAESLSAPIHVTHLSTRGSVELVRHGKARGVRVTADTCPHYLIATDEWVEGYDPNTKVNPPLRTGEDRRALIEALADGTLDCIATDHAPHHADEKRVEYALAQNGISGFETAFMLCCTALVKSGVLTLAQLIDKMAAAPARILGVEGGMLKEGGRADVTVVDPAAAVTVRTADFISKGKNTPFDGYEGYGRVVHTVADGRLVVEDGKVIDL